MDGMANLPDTLKMLDPSLHERYSSNLEAITHGLEELKDKHLAENLITAKETMIAAGVPVIPGSKGLIEDVKEEEEESQTPLQDHQSTRSFCARRRVTHRGVERRVVGQRHFC